MELLVSKAYPVKATPRVVVWLLGSWVALGAGPIVASRMAHAGRPETWFNLLAVAIAVLGLVPFLMFVATSIIRLTDEWHRHVGLVGYAIALTGALLFFVAVDFLKATHLIEPWAVTPVWPWLFGWLAIGLFGSAFWHKRRP